MPRVGTIYSQPKSRYTAGHTPFTASWTANVSRSGQMHELRPQTSPNSHHSRSPIHMRPPWDERIPVWEQRIPDWNARSLATVSLPHRLPTPFSHELSQSSLMRSTPSRDWSLLMSSGTGNAMRRPWPEYEPESSAAVGRRWDGANLGRLYEHRQPSQFPSHSASAASLSPDAGY
eukprot:CAMPEP_0115867904 /NCGR_PEP_ID=MMETSP0287-20121206/21008_1 /TAXON_ID=412157 /ORGANISM="Chrysochromulina rotalis, Strain UIO044" /LENGTH=174 /DNA_ID=CAMNT_0003322523 /DNA_START=44 /DNA_END=568 /DNA_ORIENTATION=+